MTCVQDCAKGEFCPGGVYTGVNTPAKTSCGSGMTTWGRRATSIRQCVNEAGRMYSVDASGNPTATTCPADTYRYASGAAPCVVQAAVSGLGQRCSNNGGSSAGSRKKGTPAAARKHSRHPAIVPSTHKLCDARCNQPAAARSSSDAASCVCRLPASCWQLRPRQNATTPTQQTAPVVLGDHIENC